MKSLKDSLGVSTVLSPTNGQPIRVFHTGKVDYAHLFEKDGKFFAAATEQEVNQSTALIVVKDLEKFLNGRSTKALESGDRIEITKVNFNNAVGKFV